LRPAGTNGSQDPISKISRAKWIESVAQGLEHLLCKHKALSSNPFFLLLKKTLRKSM
jgi:hypothetical protein